MKIAFAVTECVPYVKTGGLADVAGALPKALAKLGCQLKLFLPLYQSIDPRAHKLARVPELQGLTQRVGERTISFDVWRGKLPRTQVHVFFVDCPHYYHRPHPYTEDPDEDERFILFQHAVVRILQRTQWRPDILHCNDWQTALLPAFLKKVYHWDRLFTRTATLLTIHNIGYQGCFEKESVDKAGLSFDLFFPGGPLEFHGLFSFLKTGIVFADVLSTVSPTYAREIQTPEYGAGLEGVLATRRHVLHGILNGIDTEEWNPRKDRYLPHRYSLRTLAAKDENKAALLKRVGLPRFRRRAVIGMVSRLAHQKGFDLLPPVLQDLMRLPVQFVVLGSGDSEHERFLRKAARMFPKTFATHIGYDNELAHLITAGADLFLMPSRYEPCGLNQLYSLNYGTVPIVRRTGGLADTVQDYHEYYQEGNGFSFNEYSSRLLYLTVRRALDVFAERNSWQAIMKRGMRADFSWDASAKRYLALYEKAASQANV